MNSEPSQIPARAQLSVEWPTLLVLLCTYLFWGLGTALWTSSGWLSILITGWFCAQFSSLQHEALHGHPFRRKAVNEALVSPSLLLIIPYGRFRDTHLQHHFDPNLTDPYEDPESNFLDPAVWAKLSKPAQLLLHLNNTLFGRMTLGILTGMSLWLASEARLIAKGTPGVLRSWMLNMLGILPVLIWIRWTGMPFWAYAISVFIGIGLLRIRTFLEHRAHDAFRARTVIIEDRGPLALLFLNNNYHAVHHMHPDVSWYKLPGLYRGNQAHYQRRNGGYVFGSYAEIIAKYLFKAKDPVPHPLWPVRKSGQAED